MPAPVRPRARRLTVLAALTGGLACAPTHAQEPQPEILRQPHGPVIQLAQAGAFRKDYGRCLYRQNRESAHRFLDATATLPASTGRGPFDIAGIVATFQTGNCIQYIWGHYRNRSAVTYSAQDLRFILLEEAYLARWPVPGAPTAPALPRPAGNLSGPAAAGMAAVAAYADCIVDADPAGADAVLRTVPNSKAEFAAIRVLQPALDQCARLKPEGAEVAGNVRGLVADGLWTRYARRQPALPATAGEE